ncbi:hypothetical protein LTR37_015048 [Vermiconidia calcicola]|uniref:Uncharacterized protein n=1 Tax=Vermiconidia calcicola TaxID=1690605 RepID=A0ACC3MRT1_9PEZI|nr:hypothetical protein LTR37_015048 [Vermiconidia calcicola]
MPPLASIEIPVLSSSASSGSGLGKGKAPLRKPHNRRTYDDRPLPVKPSDHAPKNARIAGREIGNSGVVYHLKIGDVEINDVELDEILDYVSAMDLEEYENAQFEEERQVYQALEAEKKRLESEKLERIKERAKRKGTVLQDDRRSSDEETEGAEEALGKHGRKRPDYAQFFKKFPVRKTLKSDQDGEVSSEDDQAVHPPTNQSKAPLAELPKRRRRKRDPATGELLPLSPVAQAPTGPELKRQRRRRHPQTGELMQVGWRYDSNNEGEAYETRRDGVSSPSFRKLSISQEHAAKRQRLDTESDMTRSPSPLPTKAELAAQFAPGYHQSNKIATRPAVPRNAVIELFTSEDDSDQGPSGFPVITSTPKPLPKSPGTSQRNHRMLQAAALSSDADSSPHPTTKTLYPGAYVSQSIASPTSAKRRQASPGKTSMLNPSATRASSTDPIAEAAEDDGSEATGDDEYYVEEILDHHMSDPKTHPPGRGDTPEMLYQTKWEGRIEPTWEPADSFPGSVVNDYRRRVGLEPVADNDDSEKEPDTTVEPASDDQPMDDDGEYEVESIIAHHLSDPRTHPPQLGKTPAMLYRVKWKGYKELTWEPVSSLKGTTILQDYNRRFELAQDDGSDEDQEMSEAGQ